MIFTSTKSCCWLPFSFFFVNWQCTYSIRDTATLADLVHFEHLLLQYTSCKIQRIQEFHQKVNPAGKNSITQPRALQHFRNKNKFTLSLCLFLSNVGNCRQRISSRLGEKVKQNNFEWVGVSQKWYSNTPTLSKSSCAILRCLRWYSTAVG